VFVKHEEMLPIMERETDNMTSVIILRAIGVFVWGMANSRRN